MKYLTLSLLVLSIVRTCMSQTINEQAKMSIYEIISAEGSKIRAGTGFLINDTLLGVALVTCKHVIQNESGNYMDSIFVRRNKVLPTGQLISDTSQFILRLKVGERRYFVEHPNPGVDLVMIPFFAPLNTTVSPNESLFGFASTSILNKTKMKQLGIREGTDVELIGFSLSSILPVQNIHYCFSRFGKIGLTTKENLTLNIDGIPRTANYILLDITTRPGDSGSPVIAHIGNSTFLIGFLSAYSDKMEYGICYPVYYLYELIPIVEETFRYMLKLRKN